MNKIVAILALAVVLAFVCLPQAASAGQDGPGQSVKIGSLPPHQITPPLMPFGQDGPGQ